MTKLSKRRNTFFFTKIVNFYPKKPSNIELLGFGFEERTGLLKGSSSLSLFQNFNTFHVIQTYNFGHPIYSNNPSSPLFSGQSDSKWRKSNTVEHRKSRKTCHRVFWCFENPCKYRFTTLDGKMENSNCCLMLSTYSLLTTACCKFCVPLSKILVMRELFLHVFLYFCLLKFSPSILLLFIS